MLARGLAGACRGLTFECGRNLFDDAIEQRRQRGDNGPFLTGDPDAGQRQR